MARQEAVFSTPWTRRANPHLDAARRAAIAWMEGFGLLHGQQSVNEFVGWRLAEVAAWFYPDASAEDCATAAQMMGWYFLPFDDQHDGAVGQSPRRVAQITGALIAIVHGESAAPRMQSPTIRAFADLWCRMTRQMTPTLLARLRYHWSSYFSSQVTEAIDRVTGYTYQDLPEYFTLRAATTCAFGQNDLAEKWGGTEHRSRVAGHSDTVGREVKDALQGWQPGQVLDVYPVMQELAMRITIATMFAAWTSDGTSAATLSDVDALVRGSFIRMAAPVLAALPLPANRRYRDAKLDLYRMIGETIGAYRANGRDQGDLLSMLLGGDGSGSHLSDTEIRDQVISVFIAAIGTIAAVLSWAPAILTRWTVTPATTRPVSAVGRSILEPRGLYLRLDTPNRCRDSTGAP